MKVHELLSKEQIDDLVKNIDPIFEDEKTLLGSRKVFGKIYEVQIIVTRNASDLMGDY